MEHADKGKESSNSINEVEVTNSPIICGLPDDISLMCLARIPRKYHSVMKCVSKRWRNLICSEEWFCYRRKHKLDETWIYALCRDKSNEIFCYVLDPTLSRRYWKLIDNLPPQISKRKGIGFEALGNKLFLLGGCSEFLDSTDETDPKIVNEIKDSVVLDGKIYVRCSRYPVTPHVFAVVYEPSSGTWEYADDDMVSGWTGPAVAVDGTLYVLDQSAGTKLMMWHKERREWILVGKLSPLPIRQPCQLVAVGKSIFVVGRVLSTVVVDVDNLGNEDQKNTTCKSANSEKNGHVEIQERTTKKERSNP
ncbi:hypothetical protein JHK85_018234 [Glycine max]|nr:hypothetical protein JHK85_018234 [Glycine max]